MRPTKWWPLTALGLAILLAGCGGFFQPVNSGGGGGGGGGGGTATSGYFYLGNSASTTIAGFSVNSSGKLSAVSNSPYNLGQTTFNALAVTPGNTFLYGGTPAFGILAFSINSSGALSSVSSGTPVASGIIPASMKVDTTGKWLIVADAGNAKIWSYAINTSTGLLTSYVSSITLNLQTRSGKVGSPIDVLILPNDGVVYVSEGIAGVDIFTLNSSTGVLTYSEHLNTLDSTGSLNKDQGMATDSQSRYLFLTETVSNSVRVLTIGTNGHLSEISGSPFATGNGPIAVAVDPTDSYVYVANYADSTIGGFSLGTSGALTALSGSPYATGASPVDLAFDQTKTYLGVACSGGNPDFQVFKLDTTTPGKLDSVATSTTGPSNAAGNPISLGATRYQ